MFNFRRTIIALKNNNYLKSYLRKYSNELHLETSNTLDELTKSWTSRIIYSSYLETRANTTPFKRIKYQEQQSRKENIRVAALQEAANKTNDNEALLQDEDTNKLPKNWMDDYEFYEGGIDEEGNINSLHGTADASIAPSKVPCNGCGAKLHCASPSLPGYIPTEIFKGRTKKQLQTIICQRCHFLKHYNIALDVEVTAESYVETISKIQSEFALAIVIVDLLDFPCSIWPDMQRILGTKRPVFVVGNKVDLLPRDSNGYLEHIKGCLQQSMISSGFDAMNIKYISLISAKTGYGIEELITQLHKIWKHNGDVYLLGCTNVGKSTLFNILLNSDYCRPEATDLVRKATTCPWPGTTLQMLKFPILRPSEIRIYHRFRRLFSERGQRAAEEKLRRDQARKTGRIESAKLIGCVGRTFDAREETTDAFAMTRSTQPIVTLDERTSTLQEARWCYDTPGVLHPAQLTNLLTTDELLRMAPEEMIAPRAFRFKPGMSVFLAGLARLDFIDYQKAATAVSADDEDPAAAAADWIKIFIFTSLKQPVSITRTKDADAFYAEHLGSEVLGLPCGTAERLARWPGLECSAKTLHVVGNDDDLSCDILLSSVGWIGIKVVAGGHCTFRAWTPYARGIYQRTPALVPQANRLIGRKIRKSMAYNMAKPFIFRK